MMRIQQLISCHLVVMQNLQRAMVMTNDIFNEWFYVLCLIMIIHVYGNAFMVGTTIIAHFNMIQWRSYSCLLFILSQSWIMSFRTCWKMICLVSYQINIRTKFYKKLKVHINLMQQDLEHFSCCRIYWSKWFDIWKWLTNIN